MAATKIEIVTEADLGCSSTLQERRVEAKHCLFHVFQPLAVVL